MKSVLYATLFSVVCGSCAVAQTCSPRTARPQINDERYAEARNSGDQAFRQGKYRRALTEYRRAFHSVDDRGAEEVYFKLGEAYAMLKDFDKAYACLIQSGPGKPPKNQVIATGFGNEKARESAQILLDTIQVNKPRYPCWTFPEYLALAAILRQNGLTVQAQSAEQEGKINREAAIAWSETLAKGGSHATLAEADQAAIKVYEKNNDPKPAEILRAQATSEPPLPKPKRPWWHKVLTLGN